MIYYPYTLFIIIFTRLNSLIIFLLKLSASKIMRDNVYFPFVMSMSRFGIRKHIYFDLDGLIKEVGKCSLFSYSLEEFVYATFV